MRETCLFLREGVCSDAETEGTPCVECSLRRATEQIEAFFHCTLCLKELPAGMSPRDYVHIEAGWTQKGFQVWCVRHDVEVMHVDFLGQKVTYVRP